MSKEEYAVQATAHGSDWTFDGEPGNPPLLSKEEAIKQAKRWFGIADTVGGTARVIHFPTMKVVWDESYLRL